MAKKRKAKKSKINRKRTPKKSKPQKSKAKKPPTSNADALTSVASDEAIERAAKGEFTALCG
ncbi:MAG: hypothetical protein WA760_05710 [Pseudolabrys sp.]